MDIQSAIAALRAQGYTVTKPKVAKAPKGNAALAFHEAFQAAKYAAQAELGDHWHLIAGQSQWITVPPRLANYRFTRADGSQSVMIRNPQDYRAPAPRFWPDGIPTGVSMMEPVGTCGTRAKILSAWLDYRFYIAKLHNLPKAATRGTEQRAAYIHKAWEARRYLHELERAA